MQFTQQVVIHTAGGDTLEEDESLEDEESLDADVEDEKLINIKILTIFFICMVNMSLSSMAYR